MGPIRLLVGAACLTGSAAGGLLRQEIFRRRQHGGESSVSLQTSQAYPELFYGEQKVDHFDEQDQRTYSQRYFANFDHFKPGGPVFIDIGGEGPLTAGEVSGKLANVGFAEKLNGATVALEHRFYGKSQPFKSLETENLRYLHSRQALHDLKQFQDFLIKKHDLQDSHFFCMGGSYPGSLAAWYRLEFPNMTSGCWSASGPVHAVEDWPGFGEKVWEAVATDNLGNRDDAVSVKLYAGYEQMAGLIHDATPAASEELMKKLNVCPGTAVSKDDRDNLETVISTYPGLIMQYNNTKEPKLGAIRELVMKAKTPLEAALSVTDFLNISHGDGPGGCADNSIGATYRQLANTSLDADGPGEANAGRTWVYQTCNEFGYFQTGTSIFEKPTLYTRGASNPSQWQGVCRDIFGIDNVSARIAKTNQYYGATDPKGIKNVFFTHGELDAWSLLGVQSYPSNDREVYAEVAPLGSHCVGLYGETQGEIPGATSIRNKAMELFQKWGASGKQEIVV